MKPHKIGILFVHGIGQQPQGDTLLRFGEPFVKWLQEWFKSLCQTESVKIRKSVLGAPVLDSHTPPYSILDFETSSGTSSWLLAENWWASEIRNPPITKLAFWILTRGTWIVLSSFGKLAKRPQFEPKDQREPVSRWAFPCSIIYFFGSLLAAFILWLLVLSITIFSVIPFHKFRAFLSKFLLTILQWVGDIYVLTENPLQTAAAVTHIREDLSWLKPRCDTTVVIAHSGGVALVYEALKTGAEDVNVLITYGSGLGMVTELNTITEIKPSLFYVSFYAVLALPLLSFLCRKINFPPESILDLYSIGDNILQIIGTVVVWVIAYRAATIKEIEIKTKLKSGTLEHHINEKFNEYLSEPKLLSTMRWVDFYATYDLIPNGPLPSKPKSLNFHTCPVVNFKSIFGDHTGYWDNTDEFVTKVMQVIDGIPGTKIFSNNRSEQEQIELTALERRARVNSLAIMKKGFGFTALCFGFLLWFAGPNWLEKVTNSLPVLQHFSNTFLTFLSFSWMNAQKVVGIIFIIGPLALLYLGISGFWRVWDKASIMKFFDPKVFSQEPMDWARLAGFTFKCASVLPLGFLFFLLYNFDDPIIALLNSYRIFELGINFGLIIILWHLLVSRLNNKNNQFKTIFKKLKTRPSQKNQENA